MNSAQALQKVPCLLTLYHITKHYHRPNLLRALSQGEWDVTHPSFPARQGGQKTWQASWGDNRARASGGLACDHGGVFPSRRQKPPGRLFGQCSFHPLVPVPASPGVTPHDCSQITINIAKRDLLPGPDPWLAVPLTAVLSVGMTHHHAGLYTLRSLLA